MAEKKFETGGFRMSAHVKGPIKLFSIFSSLDLTFNYILCMFVEIIDILKPSKVQLGTQREQSLLVTSEYPLVYQFRGDVQHNLTVRGSYATKRHWNK